MISKLERENVVKLSTEMEKKSVDCPFKTLKEQTAFYKFAAQIRTSLSSLKYLKCSLHKIKTIKEKTLKNIFCIKSSELCVVWQQRAL